MIMCRGGGNGRGAIRGKRLRKNTAGWSGKGRDKTTDVTNGNNNEGGKNPG